MAITCALFVTLLDTSTWAVIYMYIQFINFTLSPLFVSHNYNRQQGPILHHAVQNDMLISFSAYQSSCCFRTLNSIQIFAVG